MAEPDTRFPHAELPLNQHWTEWSTRALGRPGAADWAGLVREMSALQDAFAASAPAPPAAAAAGRLLAQARALLVSQAADDADQFFGRFMQAPDRGQTFGPAIRLTGVSERALTGETVFGRFHQGNNSATHGGAISVLFDEMFGRLMSFGDLPPARTANLSVNYRSPTPLDAPLTVSVSVASVDGRKWQLAGTLRDGERLCADSTALFLTLKPGQG